MSGEGKKGNPAFYLISSLHFFKRKFLNSCALSGRPTDIIAIWLSPPREQVRRWCRRWIIAAAARMVAKTCCLWPTEKKYWNRVCFVFEEFCAIIILGICLWEEELRKKTTIFLLLLCRWMPKQCVQNIRVIFTIISSLMSSIMRVLNRIKSYWHILSPRYCWV